MQHFSVRGGLLGRLNPDLATWDFIITNQKLYCPFSGKY
jgi:hypothetical protein